MNVVHISFAFQNKQAKLFKISLNVATRGKSEIMRSTMWHFRSHLTHVNNVHFIPININCFLLSRDVLELDIVAKLQWLWGLPTFNMKSRLHTQLIHGKLHSILVKFLRCHLKMRLNFDKGTQKLFLPFLHSLSAEEIFNLVGNTAKHNTEEWRKFSRENCLFFLLNVTGAFSS